MSAHANPTNNLELPPVSASEEIHDECRESQLTPGEAHDEYLKLNGQITAHLDAFVGKMVDATEEFKNLILPLLDQMQSMLSKRGRLRKLLNIAGVQTWEEWFEDFERRLHLDISFRTIQRWIKDYREAEEDPPAPNMNLLAKQSVRQIESKRQAEKLDTVVKQRKKLDPANRTNLIRALKADVKTKLALIAKLEKGFAPPVTEMGKALPFTQAEITEAAKEQAAHWRKEGFPFHDKSETERGRELHLLLNLDYSSMINDGVVRQTMHGLGTAGSYFPHMMSVRSGKFRTPMEVFEDDNLFPKAIEKGIEAVGRLSLTANDIRKACMTYRGSHAVSNFKPSAAAAIYNKYLPETGGVVFDPSAGFGGRFLGALACRKVKRYVACDPATETFTGLLKMENELLPYARTTLRRRMGVELWHCGSEDMRPNLQHSSVDCVLWSPPYFDTEKYSTEPTQSYLKFPTRKSWLEGFIGATLDNVAHALKPEGVLAVNIADVPTFPDLEKAFLALAESKGWKRVDTLHIELSPMWGPREPGYEPKLEPLFVFRRSNNAESDEAVDELAEGGDATLRTNRDWSGVAGIAAREEQSTAGATEKPDGVSNIHCDDSSMVERPVQLGNGGSTPTSSLHFVPIPKALATELVVKNHYLHRKPIISSWETVRWKPRRVRDHRGRIKVVVGDKKSKKALCWGIERDGQIVGVCTFGAPMWSVSAGVSGGAYWDVKLGYGRWYDCLELTRLWVDDSVTEHCIESKFVAWCLREIKKINPNAFIVSYADSAAGHRGVIYQALGFIYCGLSVPWTDKTVAGKDHRSVSKKMQGDKIGNRRTWAGVSAVRKTRSRKHRYVKFLNPKDVGILAWKREPNPRTAACLSPDLA